MASDPLGEGMLDCHHVFLLQDPLSLQSHLSFIEFHVQKLAELWRLDKELWPFIGVTALILLILPALPFLVRILFDYTAMIVAFCVVPRDVVFY